jgi:hypothetical protein
VVVQPRHEVRVEVDLTEIHGGAEHLERTGVGERVVESQVDEVAM